MLFDNFLADKEDRFYFMFAFAIRAWLSLLFFVFVPFLLIHFGYELQLHQFMVIGASYLLMGFVDFSQAITKTLREYRRKRWVDIQHNGTKAYR
jgi:hypothetical protein